MLMAPQLPTRMMVLCGALKVCPPTLKDRVLHDGDSTSRHMISVVEGPIPVSMTATGCAQQPVRLPVCTDNASLTVPLYRPTAMLTLPGLIELIFSCSRTTLSSCFAAECTRLRSPTTSMYGGKRPPFASSSVPGNGVRPQGVSSSKKCHRSHGVPVIAID